MFRHQFSDAPEGTLAHAGYRLYLATLRLRATFYKVTGLAHMLRRFDAHARM